MLLQRKQGQETLDGFGAFKASELFKKKKKKNQLPDTRYKQAKMTLTNAS